MPVLASLLLAPALVRWSSSQHVGMWMRRRGLLLAPSEVAPGPVLETLGELEAKHRRREDDRHAPSEVQQALVTWLLRHPPPPQADWSRAEIRKAAGGN
jgi:membrane glycosyltransferase